MEETQQQKKQEEIKLTTPEGTPFSFRLIITKTEANGESHREFRVQGQDPIQRGDKTCSYVLKGNEHHAYLDLFAQLAIDFGLQVPYNRQAVAHRGFMANYHEVLCHNLAPGILYGYGDPAVIKTETAAGDVMYYLVVTSNDAPDAFPLLRSPNLTDWEHAGYVFPNGHTPEWALHGLNVSDYWAPEMHKVGTEYRVYFVARERSTNDLCIGMARSSGPEGPFQADPAPILTGNVIDPHVFVTDENTAYLFWKEDNNEVWPGRLINFLHQHPYFIPELFPNREEQVTASFILALWPWAHNLEPMERFLALQVFIEAVSANFALFRHRLSDLAKKQNEALQQEIETTLHLMKTRVFAQQLTPDGSGLTSERNLIIENDLDWEAHLVEGMWVHRQGQKYYLFYAGNDFSTDKYGIGAAVADAPLGPYRKMPEPLLYSTKEWRAPGHPSVAIAPDGKPTLFLHAYYPGKAGYKQFRALLSIPLVLDGEHISVQG